VVQVRELIDLRQVWELAKEGSGYLLAIRYGLLGSRQGACSEVCVAGADRWLIYVLEAQKLCAMSADVGDIQGQIIREGALDV